MEDIKHVYYAIFYGDWECGYELYEGKPKFGFFKCYYDGNHAALHVYNLWISVTY